MNNPTNFSSNMLKTYDSCPRKYYYKYIEKITIPKPTTPFEKGQKIHALANYFLKGINITRIETALTQNEKTTWEKLQNNKYFQKDCIKTEYPLQIRLNNFWVGGRIDAIVHNAYDYYILDYKTGSIPKNPKYDYQTMIYLLCTHKLIEDYKSLTFVYIDLKNNKDVELKFDIKTKHEYERIIINKCNEIEKSEEFSPTKTTQNCNLCEYAKLCNFIK